MSKLTVYARNTLPEHAGCYYRIVVPMETMARLPGIVCLLDHPTAQISEEERQKAMAYSDILLMYQPSGANVLSTIKHLNSLGPGKGQDGMWRWPSSPVLDTDDNLFEVNPLNPAFKTMGVRYNGEVLEPGCEIGIKTSDGVDRVIWKDGHRGFDLQKNRERIESYRELMREVAAVTTTTDRNAEHVRREVTPKAMYTFPNCIRMEDYASFNGVTVHKTDPKKIRVLWQGSASHYEDMEPMKDAITRLTRKYQEIHWIFWGFCFPWVFSELGTHRFEFIPWMSHPAYRQRLFTICHDISIAPLTRSAFNQARSAIKFYESSIGPKPACTVAQRSGPYLDEVQDGETGLLFDDPESFIEKMSLAIENERERTRIAENARDWVMEKRDAWKVVPKLVDFYKELRETRKRESPPPTEAEYEAFLAKLRQEELAEV